MDDLLESFEEYEPETNSRPAKKTPAEQAPGIHETFRAIATAHKVINPSNYDVEIFRTLKLQSGDHVISITHVNISDGCTIFIFAERSEIISSRVIQNLVNDKTMYLSKLNKEDYTIVTLSKVVHYPLNATGLSGLLYSGTFRSLMRHHSPNLVVQYTTESTIRMKSNNLFEILSRQYDVMSGDLAEWSSPTLTPLPSP